MPQMDMEAYTLPAHWQWEVLRTIVDDLQSLNPDPDGWHAPPFTECGRDTILEGTARLITQRL